MTERQTELMDKAFDGIYIHFMAYLGECKANGFKTIERVVSGLKCENCADFLLFAECGGKRGWAVVECMAGKQFGDLVLACD